MPGGVVEKPSPAAQAAICKPNRLPAELYPFVESAAVQYRLEAAHVPQVPRKVRHTLQKIAEQAGALYVSLGTLSEEARNALLDALPSTEGAAMVETVDRLSMALMGASRNAALDVDVASGRTASAEQGLVHRLANILEGNDLNIGAEPNGLLVHVTHEILKDYGQPTSAVPQLVRRALTKT